MSFPLTPNGKVDRNALPAPEPQRPVLSEEYVAPTTEGETLLAEIWQEVLRVEQVGINDNFFELGGDSLKVAQVATRIREALGVDILLRSLFENPTVGEFLPIVEAVKTSAGDNTELPISEVTRGEHIPLSFSQERVWFLHQLNPRNLAYNSHSHWPWTVGSTLPHWSKRWAKFYAGARATGPRFLPSMGGRYRLFIRPSLFSYRCRLDRQERSRTPGRI